MLSRFRFDPIPLPNHTKLQCTALNHGRPPPTAYYIDTFGKIYIYISCICIHYYYYTYFPPWSSLNLVVPLGWLDPLSPKVESAGGARSSAFVSIHSHATFSPRFPFPIPSGKHFSGCARLERGTRVTNRVEMRGIQSHPIPSFSFITRSWMAMA